MRAKVTLALLLMLLGLGTLLAGCAALDYSPDNDPYADQRRAHELEWNIDPWR
ncbi:MAG: hypothetical protein HY910_12280 [Desulfarculus sp.]|nr:hypothetical protein [Desulfarculus sp.]